MSNQVMGLNIFALGFNSKLLQNRQVFDIINEYLWQLKRYAVQYCSMRYAVDMTVQYYYPFFTPKSYDELREWDARGWRDEYFGKDLQMYVCYGLNLNPYQLDANGYAECVKRQGSDPREMMYCEMQEYHPLFSSSDPYSWWKEAGRVFFHELDHQLLFKLGYHDYIKNVHKAKDMPLLEVRNGKDRFGRQVRFWIQQDPRGL